MNHYTFICNTLANTIKETKRSYHNTKITTPENKIKTICNIVKSITNRKRVYEELKNLKIDGKYSKDYHIISDVLNDYFISTDIRANDEKFSIGKLDINNPIEHLYQTLNKNLFLVLNLSTLQLKKLKKIYYTSKNLLTHMATMKFLQKS
jgi:hypothetical protein